MWNFNKKCLGAKNQDLLELFMLSNRQETIRFLNLKLEIWEGLAAQTSESPKWDALVEAGTALSSSGWESELCISHVLVFG